MASAEAADDDISAKCEEIAELVQQDRVFRSIEALQELEDIIKSRGLMFTQSQVDLLQPVRDWQVLAS